MAMLFHSGKLLLSYQFITTSVIMYSMHKCNITARCNYAMPSLCKFFIIITL